MITTSGGAFVTEAGSQIKYNGSSIVCTPTYYELQSIFSVVLWIMDSATTNIVAYPSITLTKTEVDGETGAGTGETAHWFDALQDAVKTKLSAITENSGVTFTIV